MKIKDEFIYIWNDLVGLRDLARSLLISVLVTMGCFFLAPVTDPTKQLFFGLGGAVLAFTLNTLIVKPKRTIKIQHED